MSLQAQRNDAKRQRLEFVDTEGKPATSSGLSKPALDPEANGFAKRVLYHAHCAVMALSQMEESYYAHLETMCLITSNLWTAHTIIKQEGNGKGAVKNRVNNAVPVVLGDKQLFPEQFVIILRGVLDLYGLKPGSDAYERFKGCFQTHLTQMHSFKLRQAEVQYMNKNYTVGTSAAGKEQVVQMQLYGVQPAHMALCYGANFPPSMQTANMQQMGPATLLVGLARQRMPIYQEKWERAVNQQMSGVANMKEVARIIAGAGGTAKHFIEKTLDICAAGVVRSSCKGAIPWLFYYQAFAGSTAFQAWFGKIKITTGTVTTQENMEVGEEPGPPGEGPSGPQRPRQVQSHCGFSVGNPLTADLIPAAIKSLDMSGKGFWNFYRLACDVKFKTLHLPQGNPEHYRQAISLAMTGLYYEDLATIRHVFGRDPFLRKETVNSFADLKKNGEAKETKLWPLVHVAKMATAAQSRWGAGQDHHIIPAYRISGRGVQRVNENSALAKRLGATRDHADLRTQGEAALLEALTRQAQRIRTGILHEGSLETGTTEWFKVDGTSNAGCYGQAVNVVVERTGLTIFASSRNLE
uniref:Nucleocapsid protein n=1 Tax=Wuhan Mosquito Virus 4 TaxID=1608129 RepID=A0A1L3KKM7_9ORTO|nr:nucleocapsid protein [Wuhan Mosquito Virus 4]APG77889.1 nucleocapsid protein [Wuhan Mosquito Virus 4]